MRFYIVVIIIAFAEAGVIDDTISCITIRGNNFEKEILKDHVESPYQLAIDHDTQTLFYSYTARAEDDMFYSALISLKTGLSAKVSGIRGGFANAINNNQNIVYMGGEDGIYKFDYKTKTATNLHIKDDVNIWQMFYKDGLYFTTYPDEKVYFYKNDEVVKVPALEHVKVMLIAADRNKNLVYFNSSGMFMYERDESKTVFLNDVVANGVTSDIESNIIFSTANGIYYFNDELKEVEQIADIDNVYGVAIESDGNIIYASENSIIRLRPTTKRCKVDIKWTQ